MTYTLICKSKVLKARLTRFEILKSQKIQSFQAVMLEIVAWPDKIELHSIAVSAYIKHEGNKPFKAYVPLFYFMLIIGDQNKEYLSLRFENGRMSYSGGEYVNRLIRVEELTAESRIDLPFNPSLKDLLNLRTRYEEDVLEKTNFAERIAEAETEYQRRCIKAYNLLKPIGVRQSAFNEFVRSELTR